jgi:hypothetical protein
MNAGQSGSEKGRAEVFYRSEDSRMIPDLSTTNVSHMLIDRALALRNGPLRNLRYHGKMNYRRNLLSHDVRQRAAWIWIWGRTRTETTAVTITGQNALSKEPSRKKLQVLPRLSDHLQECIPRSPHFRLLILRSRADEWDEWPRLALDATIRSRCRQDLDVDLQKKMQPRSSIFSRAQSGHGGDSGHLDLHPIDTHGHWATASDRGIGTF